ncbi:MAG: endonuclease III [Chloroflexota bacterium]
MFDDFFNSELQERATTVYERLNKVAEGRWETTAVQETRRHRDPLRTLLSSMMSARTREEHTRQATEQLFALAGTAESILALSDAQIEQAIRPVTYHETKVGYVRGICQRLLDEHDGIVPRDLASLTALPGVGWKTATLTQWIAFGIAEEICVDVHVARIGKRLGLVSPKTSKPQAVSKELMQIVSEDLWGVWNPMMVRFGREVCYPTQPDCVSCPLNDFCPKIGVS